MGIIVGTQTYIECDNPNCKNISIPDFDQIRAIKNAYDKGWLKNETNGKTICPECRWRKNI